jgi:hypothetical protein
MTPLCDDRGQTVGYFLTVAEHERLRRLEAEHQRLLYAWARTQVTDEELDRAEQETEEFTTGEVLRSLEQP